jgi:hypothetical protein
VDDADFTDTYETDTEEGDHNDDGYDDHSCTGGGIPIPLLGH